MKSNLKAIIFDWGGVCCRSGEPFASPALQKELNMTPAEIESGAQDINDAYYLGDYDCNSFWLAIIQRYNLKQNSEINPQKLSNAYLNSYEAYDDVLAYILSLGKNYRIGLLSKLAPEMRDYIKKRHQLDKYFEVQVFSCDKDVHSSKPDAKSFLKILEKMQLKPQDCLFIDDSLKNILAARTLGFKTLLFENRKQFFNDIKNLIIV